MTERSMQCDDPRHPLHQHAPPVARLKSRRNFMQSTQLLTASKIATKEAKWEQRLSNNDIPTWNPKEKLSAGSDLPVKPSTDSGAEWGDARTTSWRGICGRENM
ncbi:hypothetical protein JTB14_010517 [Gonioctena quinquepunctata]|nr:hypothetical protein JTB14_010517 [Gonioctena quinquepunctata]